MKLADLQPRVVRLLEPETPKPVSSYVYVKRWRERNRVARNAALRKRTADNRTPRPCEHCGDTFTPAHNLTKYCTAVCRWRAEYRRKARANRNAAAGVKQVSG